MFASFLIHLLALGYPIQIKSADFRLIFIGLRSCMVPLLYIISDELPPHRRLLVNENVIGLSEKLHAVRTAVRTNRCACSRQTACVFPIPSTHLVNIAVSARNELTRGRCSRQWPGTVPFLALVAMTSRYHAPCWHLGDQGARPIVTSRSQLNARQEPGDCDVIKRRVNFFAAGVVVE